MKGRAKTFGVTEKLLAFPLGLMSIPTCRIKQRPNVKAATIYSATAKATLEA